MSVLIFKKRNPHYMKEMENDEKVFGEEENKRNE